MYDMPETDTNQQLDGIHSFRDSRLSAILGSCGMSPLGENEIKCIILLLQQKNPPIDFKDMDLGNLKQFLLNADFEEAVPILNLLLQNSTFATKKIFFSKPNIPWAKVKKEELNIMLYCLDHPSFTFHLSESHNFIVLLNNIEDTDDVIKYLTALLAHPNFNQAIFRQLINKLFLNSADSRIKLAEFCLNHAFSDEIFKKINEPSDLVYFSCLSTELGDTFFSLLVKKCPNQKSAFLEEIVYRYISSNRRPDIVLEIVKHPNFNRAKNSALRHGCIPEHKSALFWAAKNGHGKIVSLFLNDEKVPEEAKNLAIETAIEFGHTHNLALWAFKKYWPVYQCFLAAKINPESTIHLFAMLNPGFWDCLNIIGQTYIHLHASESAFFAVKKEKNVEKIISNIIDKVIDAIYSYHYQEKNNCSDTNYGVRRAKTFLYIFTNKNLTPKDKMLALYTLLSEENGNKLKNFVCSSVGYYITGIDGDLSTELTDVINAAKKYIEDIELDYLTLFKENLIGFIENKENDFSCFNEISSKEFKDMIINLPPRQNNRTQIKDSMLDTVLKWF